MCMITYVPAGIEIPIVGITNGAETNDDGHGWAVASKDGLVVGKSMNSKVAIADFIEARAKAGLQSVGLFHSRWGTHGVLGEFNIHPFYVNENSVMAHNGILPSEFHPKGSDKRSDTRIFVDKVAREYADAGTGVPSRRNARRLADIIGGSNKLVFLSVTEHGPKVRIINAWAGVFTNGVWYSNSGYKDSWRGYLGGSYYSYKPKYNWDNSGARGGVYGGSRSIWDDDEWDDDGRWSSFSKTVTDANEKPKEIAPVTMIGKATGNGYPEPKDYKPSVLDGLCPKCYSDDLSTKLGYCRDCLYCFDCEQEDVDCLCSYGTARSKDERDAREYDTENWWREYDEAESARLGMADR